MERTTDLVAATSMPIILALLAEADSYGFHIIRRVREASGERAAWTDGMLYPVLHRLERLHYVEARWETVANGRRRKYYAITARGRVHQSERGAQPHIEQHRRDTAILWSVQARAARSRASTRASCSTAKAMITS